MKDLFVIVLDKMKLRMEKESWGLPGIAVKSKIEFHCLNSNLMSSSEIGILVIG